MTNYYHRPRHSLILGAFRLAREIKVGGHQVFTYDVDSTWNHEQGPPDKRVAWRRCGVVSPWSRRRQ